MRGTESTSVARSICSAATSREIAGNILPRTFSLSFIAKQLWPLKAAAHLHNLTGASDRTCRSWAAGDVDPPAWVLAALICSDDGERVVALLVGEFGPRWWRHLQRSKYIADDVLASVAHHAI